MRPFYPDMDTRFSRVETKIAGLIVVERKPLGDSRGFLERMFCAETFRAFGMARTEISQINHTVTEHKGTIRGMHYQLPPYAEEKVISCLKGDVYDVIVDVRQGSPTFLQWHAERLSEGNHKTLIVPVGCAHGFQALTDACEMLYFHTKEYTPQAERGLYPMDSALKIEWPMAVTTISQRDSSHPEITELFTGVEI